MVRDDDFFKKVAVTWQGLRDSTSLAPNDAARVSHAMVGAQLIIHKIL